jgi:hypothetical protein
MAGVTPLLNGPALQIADQITRLAKEIQSHSHKCPEVCLEIELIVNDCLVQHTRLPPGVNVCISMHVHTYIDASGLLVE